MHRNGAFMRFGTPSLLWLGVTLVGWGPLWAQEPVAWGEELVFHAFSIVAVDPATGESSVAVTTRNPCVGNGVPCVRAGVGAVATQARTRTEYGEELLDLLEEGWSPQDALDHATASDEEADRRQIGVVGMDGISAQHTGTGPGAWAGHRSGPNHATQGNVLVGPGVIDAVAATFEASEGSGRHLADRLVEALTAGQQVGGDRRKGRLQSAAVIIADPREGRARRSDGLTVQINVCETPVAELRRIYSTVSQTLGFRSLQQFSGRDVWQVKLIMHALGYYRSGTPTLEEDDGWLRHGSLEELFLWPAPVFRESLVDLRLRPAPVEDVNEVDEVEASGDAGGRGKRPGPLHGGMTGHADLQERPLAWAAPCVLRPRGGKRLCRGVGVERSLHGRWHHDRELRLDEEPAAAGKRGGAG